MADDLRAVRARQRAAALAFAHTWGNSLLGEAQRIVPLEEGTLAASGTVDVQERGDRIDVVVRFSTPYAARQHEEAGWQHRTGRQAKYLEAPAKRLAPAFLAGAAAAIGRAAS